MTTRDEGGAIIPFFNDRIDAISDKVGGFTHYPSSELMSGMALAACWLTE